MTRRRIKLAAIVTYFVVTYALLVFRTMLSHPVGCGGGAPIQTQPLEENLLFSRNRWNVRLANDARDKELNITLQDTMNVLFAISEDSRVTIAELEVALKSVLLHAPVNHPLTVHIMADTPAYLDLDELWISSRLSSWRTRNPISIHAYHIAPRTVDNLRQKIRTFFQGAGYKKSQMHLLFEHTIGAYFRLHAHMVLPAAIQRVLYMDTDVVLLANLQTLMPLLSSTKWENDDGPFFYWTTNMCSGFMIIDIGKLPFIWNLTATIDLKRIGQEKLKNHRPNDQLILRAVNMTFPDKVGILSSEIWDGHIADSLWRFPFKVSEHRPRLGMLHFNGGGADMGAYFERHNFLTQETPDTQKTFGLVKEQVYLPWSWTQFRLESMIRPGDRGYALTLNYTTGSAALD
jgi:hypothetical protein